MRHKILRNRNPESPPLNWQLGRRYREGYYVCEISRNLGIGLGSVSQSLRTLEEAGLVLKEHKGRLVSIFINSILPCRPLP
jgi:DNA-binding transcriptional ArsR family regulator